MICATKPNLIDQNIELLDNAHQLQLWADHLSQLSPENYTTAYEMLVLNLASIITTAKEVDPYLSGDGRIYNYDYKADPLLITKEAQRPFQFLVSLVNQPESTLHRMLFSPLDSQRIYQPLTGEIKTINKGLGWQRPDDLRDTLKKQQNFSEENKDNFDTARAALMYTSDTTSLKNQGDALTQIIGVANVVVAAFSGLEGIVAKAHAEIVKLQSTELKDLTSHIETSNARIKTMDDLWDRLESKGKQLKQQANKQTQKIGELGNKSKNQDEKISTTQQQKQGTSTTIEAIQGEKSHVNYNAYHQKLWLLEQNTDELLEKLIDGSKNKGKATIGDAFIGRVKLYQAKGAGDFWKALAFDNNRNTLGGLLKNFYVGEFSRYKGNEVLEGLIVKVPLANLTPEQSRTFYKRTLSGQYQDENQDTTATTKKGSLDPTVKNPEREMVFFVKKGTKEAEIVEQANAYNQVKTPAKSERARLQQELNAIDTKRNAQLHYKHRELIEMQQDYDAALDKNLVFNPEKSIIASEDYLTNLDAQENWAQANLEQLDQLETNQQAKKAAIDAELDNIKKQRIETEQRLKNSVAAAKKVANLKTTESQHLNSYLENTEIVHNKIAQLEKTAETAQKTTLYRVANTGYFRGFIIGLQLYNFKVAWESYDKSKLSTLTGVFSAGLDLGLAVEDYIAFITKTANKEIGLRKVLFRINTSALPKIFQAGGRLALQELVLGLVILQASAGLLITIKSALEIYEAIGTRENGLVTTARWMALASGLLAIASPFLAVSVGVLFPPVLIASIVIGLVAAGIVALFSDSELERWIKNGPFSESNSYYSYLQDSTEAFYRLVSACAQITLTNTREEYIGKKDKTYYRYHVTVTSLLASLLCNKAEYQTVVILQTNSGRRRLPKLSRPKPLPNNQGITYQTLTNNNNGNYRCYVKCQFMMLYQNELLVFPAPPIVKNDALSYKDGIRYTSPQKVTDNEPFWGCNLG